MELGPDELKFKSGIKRRRRGKLDELMSSEQGRTAIDEMVLFIASRASVVSSAARIGVNPNTLTKWLSRGKQESDGVYRELWDRVVIALGQATAEAEVELNQMKPEFYLKFGPARLLLGDVYNVEKQPTSQFNLDGSVTLDPSVDSPTGIRENTSEQIGIGVQDDSDSTGNNLMNVTQQRVEQQDNELTLEALAALRDNGIDVNNLIDDLIEKNKLEKTIEVKSGLNPDSNGDK